MRGDLNRHGMRGGTRKKGEGQPGRPPARGTRTIRMCSFDDRSQVRHGCRSREGQTGKFRGTYLHVTMLAWTMAHSEYHRTAIGGRIGEKHSPEFGG